MSLKSFTRNPVITVLLFIELLFICIAVTNSEDIEEEEEEEGSKRESRAIPSYNGEWDISAKHTAQLCEAMKYEDFDMNLGLPDPDASTYLRDGKCWKNQWIPCEDDKLGDDRLATNGVLSRRRKPCGHYKMVSAPKTQCL